VTATSSPHLDPLWQTYRIEGARTRRCAPHVKSSPRGRLRPEIVAISRDCARLRSRRSASIRKVPSRASPIYPGQSRPAPHRRSHLSRPPACATRLDSRASRRQWSDRGCPFRKQGQQCASTLEELHHPNRSQTGTLAFRAPESAALLAKAAESLPGKPGLPTCRRR